MTKYSRAATTALNLITRYGTTGLLQRLPVGYDPIRQTLAGGPPADKATVAVIQKAPKSDYQPGTIAAKRAMAFSIALKGVSMVPQAGDTLTVGSIAWQLVEVDNVDPAGEGAFVCLARGER